MCITTSGAGVDRLNILFETGTCLNANVLTECGLPWSETMKHSLRIHLSILHVLLTLSPVAAMGQTIGSDEENAILPDYMIAVPIEDLPRPDAQMWMFWLTMQPGAEFTPTPEMSTTLLLVEEGSVAVTNDSPIVVRTSGDISPPLTVVTDDAGYSLTAGDGALLAETSNMRLSNTGSEIAEVAMLVMTSARSTSAIVTPVN